MKFLNRNTMKVHAVNTRKAKQDRFGILARSMHTPGYLSRRSTRSPKGWSLHKELKQRAAHQAKFPPMQFDPLICNADKRHWTRPKAEVANQFGKGQVLYTMREGGTWQKWPWNWVPSARVLEVMREEWPETIATRKAVPMHKEDKAYPIRVHSMLIDGRRWDCINGFTN